MIFEVSVSKETTGLREGPLPDRLNENLEH